jgi:uncharacterized protein YprB with RNaseH-like and TPR domain
MEEDAALMMGWPEFNRRFNGDSEEETISYNAYRFKRARLLNDDATSQTTSAVFINEYTWKPGTTEVREQFFEPGGYVGLTHGFFDIETTFSTQPRVLYAAVGDSWGNIKQFTRDMYPGEDKLFDDKELVEAYVKELQTFDILIGWNSKAFDVPVLNGRLAYHNSTIGRVDPKMHIDLMWYATGQFMKIGRRSLESVSSYFGTSNRKTPLDVRTWDRAVAGDDDAYRSIAEHCDADVLVLRDVFSTLKSHIRNVHR